MHDAILIVDTLIALSDMHADKKQNDGQQALHENVCYTCRYVTYYHRRRACAYMYILHVCSDYKFVPDSPLKSYPGNFICQAIFILFTEKVRFVFFILSYRF